MSLAFDFGNSSVKVGVFNAVDLAPVEVWQFGYHHAHDDFNSFLEKYPADTSVIISTVVSESHAFAGLTQKFVNRIFLSHRLKLPFAIDYKTPETLGNDRLAACAGATVLCAERPILVIDAGTCITYDFITEDNCYAGGAISPGIELKLKAMHHFTQKLPSTTLPPDYQPFNTGKSTLECMWEGAAAGTIHEIRGFIATFSSHKSLNVVITGGTSHYLANKLENSTFAAPNLVLIGLHKIKTLNA
ncbi:type III pantothenate kinase [bacterium]|nr:type III pantothenate kinase [bacterium]